MAEVKIDIPGLGEITANNAASESTLKEIAKLLAKNPRPTTDDSDKKNTESKKKNTEATKESTGAVKAFGGALTGIIGGAFNGLLAGIGAVIGTLPGLASEIAFGGQQLTDFARHLPIPGLGMLTAKLDEQVSMYKDLSNIGAGFGNNMFELTRIAGQAAIPQKDFAALIAENTVGMRIFGGTVADGAKRFAGLSKELRQSPVGQRLMELGFTSQDLNENFLSYSEMMQVSGRRSNMTNKQLIEGSLKYSSELDKIARLTGKSRKEIEAEMKTKNLDIRRQMAINKHGEEFGLRLQQLAATSPALEAALLDMADGVANDPLTQQLMANNATFRTQAQNVQNMTAEQAAQFAVNVGKDGLKFAKTLGDAGTQAAIAAGGSAAEYLQMTGQLQTAQTTQKGATDKEQAARDALTAKMATFAETVADIQGKIQVAFVDSGIFKQASDMIADFIPSGEEAKTMFDKLSADFKDKILPRITTMWEWLKGDGYTGMKGAFGKIIDWAKDFLLGAKAGGDPRDPNSEKRSGGLLSVIGGIGDSLGKMWTDNKPMIDNFIQVTLPDLLSTISTLWATWKPEILKFFTNLFTDPAALWKDTIKPMISSAFGSIFEGLGWGAIALSVTLAVVKAIGALNPWVKIATLLFAGIATVFDWEAIKSKFSASELGKSISTKFNSIVAGISNLFSWENIKSGIRSMMPDWTPKWIKDKMGASPTSSSTSPVTKNPEVVTQPTVESSSAVDPEVIPLTNGPASGEDGWWDKLSTKIDELKDEFKKNTTATRELKGNLQ